MSTTFPFATEMKSGGSADTIIETRRIEYIGLAGNSTSSEDTKLKGTKRNTRRMNLGVKSSLV